MGYKLKIKINLIDVLSFLEIDYSHTKETVIEIDNVSSLDFIENNSLSFTKSTLQQDINCAVFINNDKELPKNTLCQYIPSKNPRLDFIRTLDYLNNNIGFKHFDFESEIHPTVSIGKNVVIERGCKVAEGVILEHNVVIHSGTKIGKNTRIRANSSIGGDGFGFERLENGRPIRFPHLGGVYIGNDVEIGSNTCIVRGTLSNTIIRDNVKIDNLVHLAHNCIIEEGAFIIAGAEVSGGVHIGKNAWIGPNASIIQKVSIGTNSLVGIGAVVTKSIENNKIYAGNPAKFIRDIE